MNELQIIELAAGVLLAVTALVFALHFLYRGLPSGRAKDALRKIIYEIDRAADNMSNAQKKQNAINLVRDSLGWKRILVPASILGFLIDCEVAAVRKAQAVTQTPNLHEESEQT